MLEAAASYTVLQMFLKAVPISDKTANHVIKSAYDIIMELVRAQMLKHGFNTTGAGAHEVEVAYLERLEIPPNDIVFADKLRYYRNGIVYYGKSFDAQYARKVLRFMEEIRKRYGDEK